MSRVRRGRAFSSRDIRIFQMLFELDIREYAYLWQDIHAPLDFDHHVPIVSDQVQAVLVDHFC